MIDSRIALGIRPPEFESPMNGLAKMLQLQGLQQANQLNTMTLQDKQRGLEEDNRLRDYFAKNDPNGPDFVRGLYGISPTQGGLYEKARLASKKDQAEIDAKRASTDKTRSEIVDARLKQSRALLDGVQTPEQYMAWHEGNHQDPVLGPMLAARGITADSSRAQIEKDLQKPGGFEQLLQKSALGMEKFTELNKPTYQTQNTGDRTTLLAMPGLGGAPTTVSTAAINQSPDNRASNDRAQSEGDKNRAQSDRHFKVTQDNAGNTYDAERGVVVNTRTQTATPVLKGGQPLGPKDKPMTEGQAKANLFGSRMQAADKIIGAMAKEGVEQPGVIKRVAGSVPLVGGGLAAVTNVTQSDKQQQVEQAQRDFLNAVLRRESGAVIGEDEFASGQQQYFPQPGDKPDVIKQKAANRKLAIEGILAEVPGKAAQQRNVTVDW